MDPKALPKFPPVAARDALNTFQLRKGFRLELVAAEPLVTDPIALAFDEDGRLFVVEMNDYPERGEQLLGQVRRLEDTDGDGRFDKSTVFAKGLRWPSAIACYGGGVFVGSDSGSALLTRTPTTTAWPTKSRSSSPAGETAPARSIPRACSAALPGDSTTRFMAWSTATPASSPIPTIPPQNPSRSGAILLSIRGP